MKDRSERLAIEHQPDLDTDHGNGLLDGLKTFGYHQAVIGVGVLASALAMPMMGDDSSEAAKSRKRTEQHRDNMARLQRERRAQESADNRRRRALMDEVKRNGKGKSWW